MSLAPPAAAAAAAVDVTQVTAPTGLLATGGATLFDVRLKNAGTTTLTQGSTVALAVSGLPAGVSAAPAPVGGCTAAGSTLRCPLPQAVPPGQSVHLVGLLRATGAAQPRTRLRAVVGTGAGTSAALNLRIARAGAPNAARLLLRAQPTSVVHMGQRSTVDYTVTNLSGSTLRRGVRLAGLLPPGVAARATGAGAQWRCGAGAVPSSCTWHGPALVVGASTPALRLTLTALDRIALPAAPGPPRAASLPFRTAVSAGPGVRLVATSRLLVSPQRPAAPKPQPRVPRTAGIQADVTALTSVRPGGLARFSVHAAAATTLPTTGPTTVSVALPHGTRVASAVGGQWRCGPGGAGVICRYPHPIAKGARAPAIQLTVRAPATLTGSTLPAKAQVAWTSAGRPQRDTASAAAVVEQPLRVHASTPHPTLLGRAIGVTGAATRTLHLVGRIRGINPRHPVAYRWRQVCPGACGTAGVRWLGGTGGSRALPTVVAQAVVPAVIKRTVLTFQVQASENGSVASDTVRIVVLPRRLAQLMPARASARRVVAAPPVAALPAAAVSRRAVPRVAPVPSPPPHAPRLPATTAAATSGFCTMFAAASAKKTLPVTPLGAGNTIAPGAVTTSGGRCTAAGAQIAFSAGTASIGAQRFTGLTGTITAAGLSVRSGVYVPPSAWSAVVRLPQLPFDSGQNAAIVATFAGKGFAAPAGQVAVGSFLFLPLPGGWTGSTTLTLSPTSRTLALSASATGGGGTSAALTGTVASNGTFTVTATAADIATFTGAGGATATASGTGTVAQKTPGGPVTSSVTATLSTASFPLFAGVDLTRASLTWDAAVVHLKGGLTVPGPDGPVALSVAGAYASASSWSVEVAQAAGPSWTVGDLNIGTLSGRLAQGKGGLSFDVTGSATGLQLPGTVSLTSATASLTNACPKGTPNCVNGNVNLLLAVAGTITAPDTGNPTWSGTAGVDLSTGAFAVTGKISGAFGPSELSLSDITIRIASNGAAGCGTGQATTRAGTGSGLQVSFSAQASVFGSAAAVQGAFGANGFCLQGDLDGFDPVGATKRGGSQTGLVIAYSSYATKIAAPGGKTIAIAADEAVVYGAFQAPAFLSNALGGELSGSGFVEADVTDGTGGLGFSGTVSYTLASPITLIGSSGATNLTLNSLSMNIDYSSTGGLDLSIAAGGVLNTPAGGQVGAASIPLAVSLGVNVTKATITLAAYTTNHRPVANAFGQPGLTLDALDVQGEVGGSDGIGVVADAVLPEQWVSSIGITAGTPIDFALNVSDTSPCLQLSIGSQTQTTTAINLDNQGILTATYANIILAPDGCTFANGTTIKPGFALDFDGTIGTASVTFDAALGLSPSGFSLTANVQIGTWEVCGVDVDQTTLNLDLDPSTSTYDVSFSGGVTVGDSSVTVAGTVDENAGATNISFTANANLSFAGQQFGSAAIAYAYSDAGGSVSMSFTVAGQVAIFDQSVSGSLTLDYDDGALQQASGNLDVNLNLAVASISGGNLCFFYTTVDQTGGNACSSAATGTGTTVTFGGAVDIFGWQAFTLNGSLLPSGAYSVTGSASGSGSSPDVADAIQAFTFLGGFVTGQEVFSVDYDVNLNATLSGGAGQPLSATVTGNAGLTIAYQSWVTYEAPSWLGGGYDPNYSTISASLTANPEALSSTFFDYSFTIDL